MSTISVPQQVCKCSIDGSPCICTAAGCFCSGPLCKSKTLADNANYKHATELLGKDFANQIAAAANNDAVGEPIGRSLGNGPKGQPKPPKPTTPCPAGSKGTDLTLPCQDTEGKLGSSASQNPRGPCCKATKECQPKLSVSENLQKSYDSKFPDEDDPASSSPLVHLPHV
ncbi:hypothetical protein TWF506_010961 [Arthrobotrys conoides]|uniref:Uncharacterized protein n=1 Tax=Arthrobotrys conoides TaxID=74498 RepID=A0AAN8N5F2_9PEZI